MRAGLTSLAAATARRLPLRARLFLYRLGPVTEILRRAINRVVPAGVHPVRVAAGELEGSWLLLDLQVDKDLWLGSYEPQLAAAIRLFVPQAGVTYDLGANIGYTALLLAHALGPAGQVFAFEPLAANLLRLRRAVALNGLGARITIVPTAVGAGRGPASFQVHSSGAMGRLQSVAGRGEGFVATTTVDVVTLDDFVFSEGHPPPQVVKLDLEGGEGAALQGMSRLLREQGPCLLVELHGPQASAEVAGVLRTAGYHIHRMQDGYPEADATLPHELPRHIVALPSQEKG
jgi:FkbM family methyltransferase